MVLTLKNKELVILPAKWIYLGIVEELQCGTSKLWLTVGKSKFRGKGLAFREEKEDRRVVWKIRVLTASHWLSVAVSHWLGYSQELKPEGHQLKGPGDN